MEKKNNLPLEPRSGSISVAVGFNPRSATVRASRASGRGFTSEKAGFGAAHFQSGTDLVGRNYALNCATVELRRFAAAASKNLFGSQKTQTLWFAGVFARRSLFVPRMHCDETENLTGSRTKSAAEKNENFRPTRNVRRNRIITYE